jgi:hypothetical protein
MSWRRVQPDRPSDEIVQKGNIPMSENIWYVSQTKVINAALPACSEVGSEWALADGELRRQPLQAVSATCKGLPQEITDPDHRAA